MAVTADAGEQAQTPGSATGTAPSRADGVVIGMATVIVGAFGVMAAAGEVFPDALVFMAVLAAVAVWAWRSNSVRSRWVAGALVTLFVLINLVFAIPDLSHPESPAPFVATAVVVGAGIITAVLAVLSARGRPVAGRRVWLPAVGGLAIVVIVALVAAAGVEDDEVQPGDTEIAAADFEFPETVDVASDSSAVAVHNEDRNRHTFVVEDEISAVELPAGSTVRVELDLEPGEYRYYCDIVGHEDMEGTLVVQ